MNQEDFLRQLRRELTRVGQDGIDDILADFTEHFANGIAMGKSEAEIALELGDPVEIASQYRSEQPGQALPETVYVTKPDNRGWMTAFLVILNLFVILPLALSVIGILLSLWLGASGIGIAAGALLVAAVVKASFVSIILVMFGLSLTALMILAFIGSYFLTKLFVVGLIHYIRWNKQLIHGGAAA